MAVQRRDEPGPRGAAEGWLDLVATFGGRPVVLYLAGPLRGDGSPAAIQANQARMAQAARVIQALLPEAVLVVPHSNFAFLDESGPDGLAIRARILAACAELVRRSDGLVLCGPQISPGMAMEKAVADSVGLPVVQVAEAWAPRAGRAA